VRVVEVVEGSFPAFVVQDAAAAAAVGRLLSTPSLALATVPFLALATVPSPLALALAFLQPAAPALGVEQKILLRTTLLFFWAWLISPT
jgi:hypothetical protein